MKTLEDIQSALDDSPFINALRMKVRHWDATGSGLIVIELPMSEIAERKAGSGQMHGGPIASLIDTAGCFAASVGLGYSIPTISFSTNYLRPVANSSAIATAKVQRLGRSIGVVDVEVRNDDGVLVAIGRAEYSMRVG